MSGTEKERELEESVKDRFWRGLLVFTAAFMALTCLFYWIVKDDWKQTLIVTDPVNQDSIVPGMKDGTLISQTLTVRPDRLDRLVLTAGPLPGETLDGSVTITLRDGDAQELARWQISQEDVTDNGQIILPVTDGNRIGGRKAELTIEGADNLAVWYGNTRSAGKFDVEVESEGVLTVNGEPLNGELVLRQEGICQTPYMDYFWYAAAGLLCVCCGVLLWAHARRKSGRLCVLNRAVDTARQYQFLLRTLVVRDFRVKYKASILGVFWSFLNPLLMTLVYWFVFSTIFQNSIENFVVYVMSGIVLFNYLSDSTNLGMLSIVGNAGLITKVYMPKFILPISKVLSSAINLLISMIPLLIITAVTGVPFHRSMLLLPLVLLLLIVFCAGIALFLSACMVFFRDVQFLWSVLLTVWSFMSPLFYPESIIPARFLTLYHMNPMYQYLYFTRTIILGGVSPAPVSYLYCILCSAVALTIGMYVFRHNQDKFILYL